MTDIARELDRLRSDLRERDHTIHGLVRDRDRLAAENRELRWARRQLAQTLAASTPAGALVPLLAGGSEPGVVVPGRDGARLGSSSTAAAPASNGAAAHPHAAGEGQCLAGAHNPSTPGATPGPAIDPEHPYLVPVRPLSLPPDQPAPLRRVCSCGRAIAVRDGLCEACLDRRADLRDEEQRGDLDGEL